jgi:hypothetical protein
MGVVWVWSNSILTLRPGKHPQVEGFGELVVGCLTPAIHSHAGPPLWLGLYPYAYALTLMGCSLLSSLLEIIMM